MAEQRQDRTRRFGPRQVVVFVAGLLLIALGCALVVLPGPLTIPPIVAGVWLWSREFTWAERLTAPVRTRADRAWSDAKQRPVLTGVVTAGGLVLAGAIVWAVLRYDLVERGQELVGIGT